MRLLSLPALFPREKSVFCGRQLSSQFFPQLEDGFSNFFSSERSYLPRKGHVANPLHREISFSFSRAPTLFSSNLILTFHALYDPENGLLWHPASANCTWFHWKGHLAPPLPSFPPGLPSFPAAHLVEFIPPPFPPWEHFYAIKPPSPLCANWKLDTRSICLPFPMLCLRFFQNF